MSGDRRRRCAAALAAVGLLSAACAGPSGEPGADPWSSSAPSSVPSNPTAAASSTAVRPLAGKVVVLDPGHRAGNRAHPAQIRRGVDAGGFTKECNTTGTASADGYAEADFTWEVARRMTRTLRARGVRVVLTRPDNAETKWGPCIDERGRIGNPGQPGPTGDLRLSLHGDGSLSAGAHGFHVIRPGLRRGWTDDIEASSRPLAEAVRSALLEAGFVTSTYAGRDGRDVRTDLGTLNHSDIPAVMVELGNMRNAGDAASMVSADGQDTYAAALVAAVEEFLAR